MDWYTNSNLLRQQLAPNDFWKFYQNLQGKYSAELNYYSINGSFTHFDRISFQVQIEKKQTPLTETKL